MTAVKIGVTVAKTSVIDVRIAATRHARVDLGTAEKMCAIGGRIAGTDSRTVAIAVKTAVIVVANAATPAHRNAPCAGALRRSLRGR